MRDELLNEKLFLTMADARNGLLRYALRLRYAAHCVNRAEAQNNCPAVIQAGGKLGATSGAAQELMRREFDNGAIMPLFGWRSVN